MKLLFLSANEVLNQHLLEEGGRHGWDIKCIADPTKLQDSIHLYEPDFILAQVADSQALQLWNAIPKSINRPVIFLHDESSEEFFTMALKGGADAFIHRPHFSPRYFEAYARSLLRVQGIGSVKFFSERLNLSVDSERCQAAVAGEILDLTLTEFKILRELVADNNDVIPRSAILNKALGHHEPNKRSLDVHVCALRKKVRRKGLDIESVRGVGYRLNLVTPEAQ